MFVLTLLADTIRIPPQLLAKPTVTSVQTELDKRYPNKIIIDVGLIICPYGPPLEVGDGILVPGDGGAHHQVLFQCVVFRPFVEEVLVGTVKESHEGGVTVSVGGFFDHVFIPAYWMLNPSRYDAESGLWVWTPTYDNDEDDEGDESGDDGEEEEVPVKLEEGSDEPPATSVDVGTNGKDAKDDDEDKEEEGESNSFEIEIGSEIRFKVKAVNFTRITTTMKGVQATTTTTSHASDRAFGLNGDSKPPSPSNGNNGSNGNNSDGEEDDADTGAIRRRSSSADLSDAGVHPAPMQIVGSICEDGLGLTSWWKNEEEEEEEEEEEIEDDGSGEMLKEEEEDGE